MSGTVYVDTVTGELKYQGTSGTSGILADATGSVPLVPCTYCFSLVSYLADCTKATFQSMGNILFNPASLYAGSSKITRTITFDALIYGSSSVTAQIRLYNVTDATIVSGTVLSSGGASSPIKVSTPLVPGVEIPNSEKQYEMQMKILFPALVSPGDFAFCSYSAINVNYT